MNCTRIRANFRSAVSESPVPNFPFVRVLFYPLSLLLSPASLWEVCCDTQKKTRSQCGCCGDWWERRPRWQKCSWIQSASSSLSSWSSLKLTTRKEAVNLMCPVMTALCRFITLSKLVRVLSRKMHTVLTYMLAHAQEHPHLQDMNMEFRLIV